MAPLFFSFRGRRPDNGGVCCKFETSILLFINPSKKFGNLCLIDHFSVVTVLLAFNFISLESLFISLYNDAPVVMNMHLWAEQHS